MFSRKKWPFFGLFLLFFLLTPQKTAFYADFEENPRVLFLDNKKLVKNFWSKTIFPAHFLHLYSKFELLDTLI